MKRLQINKSRPAHRVAEPLHAPGSFEPASHKRRMSAVTEQLAAERQAEEPSRHASAGTEVRGPAIKRCAGIRRFVCAVLLLH